jgi:hypothetical protein
MPILRSQSRFLDLASISIRLIFPFSKPYEWRGLRQTHGLRSKARRVLSQFSPHDFTTFKWEGTASFLHYFTVVLLLTMFLAAELNPFYLKVSSQGCKHRMELTDVLCISAEFAVDGTGSSYRSHASEYDRTLSERLLTYT